MSRVQRAPGRELETREQALERLLRVALDVILGDRKPEHPTRLDEAGVGPITDDVLFGQAQFWLELVPRGAKPVADVPAHRIGQEAVVASRVRIARERLSNQ